MEIRREPAPHAPGDYYVAYLDGIRVGHLFVDADLKGRIDADVHPLYRRRGIATALYLHAARARGGRLTSRIWEQSTDAYALWDSFERLGHMVVRDRLYAHLILATEPAGILAGEMRQNFRDDIAARHADLVVAIELYDAAVSAAESVGAIQPTPEMVPGWEDRAVDRARAAGLFDRP